MSISTDMFAMNLHEKCLLKYLINPLDLYVVTEQLRQTNERAAKNLTAIELIAKNKDINYTGTY